MDDQKKTALAALRKSLEDIVGYDAERLAKGENLGAIDFAEAKEVFDLIIGLAKDSQPLSWELLPTQQIVIAQNPTKTVAETLKKISEFTLDVHENPKAERDGLLKAAAKHYEPFLTTLMKYIPFLTLKSTEIREMNVRLSTLLEDTNKKATELLESVEKKKTEAESIVRVTRDAAAKVGVAQFATKFEDIAKAHSDCSKRWLKATVALGFCTIAIASLFAWFAIFKEPELSVQQAISEVVLVSLFYITAVWSAKNYRAHRHLAVVNYHRQNALATFQTFVKAAGDQDVQTKNAVLLEATRCIFSPSTTGYISSDTDTSGNRIVEILKTVQSAAE